MQNRFQLLPLAGLVNFKTGKLNSNAAKPDGMFPFFTCSQETFLTDTWSFDGEYVLLAGNNAAGIYPLKYFKGKFDAYQRTYTIRTIDENMLGTRYVYYALRLQLELMKSISTGVATKFLTLPLLNQTQIPVPPFPTQRKIAAILSAYDDLIENNRRRIKILEEMAQNLYREWFVKFRFPGHQHARFIDSPLGRIPEGWEVKTLGSLVTIDKGLSYKGEFLTSDGVPMVNLKCIPPGGGFNRKGTKPYAGEHKSRHRVVSGDLIFANTDLTQAGNIIGSPGLVPRYGFDQGGLATHHICIVRVEKHSPIDKIYLFHLLQSGGFREHAKACASGTTVLGFRPDDALIFEFTLPPQQLTKQFEQIAMNLYDLGESLNDSNTSLRRTRDLLLPRLISGEVDVTEVDITVSEEAQA